MEKELDELQTSLARRGVIENQRNEPRIILVRRNVMIGIQCFVLRDCKRLEYKFSSRVLQDEISCDINILFSFSYQLFFQSLNIFLV